MIWNKEDIDDFITNRMFPPYHIRKGGFCGGARYPFVVALSIAIDPKYGSTLLLEALKEKYPEAVEAHMQEAENMLKVSA